MIRGAIAIAAAAMFAAVATAEELPAETPAHTQIAEPGPSSVEPAPTVPGSKVYTLSNTPKCPKAEMYPPEARKKGLEGAVILLILVEVDGHVRNVRIGSSSGSELLDEQAAACVLRASVIWATGKDGQPVPGWYRAQWNWKLRN